MVNTSPNIIQVTRSHPYLSSINPRPNHSHLACNRCRTTSSKTPRPPPKNSPENSPAFRKPHFPLSAISRTEKRRKKKRRNFLAPKLWWNFPQPHSGIAFIEQSCVEHWSKYWNFSLQWRTSIKLFWSVISKFCSYTVFWNSITPIDIYKWQNVCELMLYEWEKYSWEEIAPGIEKNKYDWKINCYCILNWERTLQLFNCILKYVLCGNTPVLLNWLIHRNYKGTCFY